MNTLKVRCEFPHLEYVWMCFQPFKCTWHHTPYALLTACSGFCWLLAALLRIHWRFWSDMTRLGCSRFWVGAMVMVAGVVGKPGPELGTGLVAKGTGWATAARASVVAAATMGTEAAPGAVVFSAGAAWGGAEMGCDRGVVWATLFGCRNVDGSATYCWGVACFGVWPEAWAGISEICWEPGSCMKGGGCVELTVAETAAGVEAWGGELWLSRVGASRTVVEWEQGVEEVGFRVKEMMDEVSFTTGWVEVSRQNCSARLSEKRKKNQYNCSWPSWNWQLQRTLTTGMGVILADTVLRTLEHELKDFHWGNIIEVQILSLQ